MQMGSIFVASIFVDGVHSLSFRRIRTRLPRFRVALPRPERRIGKRQTARQEQPAAPLSNWPYPRISAGGIARINASIRQLAQRETAALKHAHHPAVGQLLQQLATDELLRCEIPDRQTLQRYKHRPNPSSKRVQTFHTQGTAPRV